MAPLQVSYRPRPGWSITVTADLARRPLACIESTSTWPHQRLRCPTERESRLPFNVNGFPRVNGGKNAAHTPNARSLNIHARLSPLSDYLPVFSRARRRRDITQEFHAKASVAKPTSGAVVTSQIFCANPRITTLLLAFRKSSANSSRSVHVLPRTSRANYPNGHEKSELIIA